MKEFISSRCKIVTKDSDWLSVCDWGFSRSYKTAVLIEKILKREFSSSLTDRSSKTSKSSTSNRRPHSLQVLELCGADFALRCSLYSRRKMVCMGRPGYTKRLQKELAKPQNQKYGFILVPTEKTELTDISSTNLRSCIVNNRWKEAVSNGMPDSVEFLKLIQQFTQPKINCKSNT